MDMEIKECYEQMGANYENVLSRLGSDALIRRFASKFPDDTSFQSLEQAMKEKNIDEAFRAAHTLKGVCLNLGFDNLFTVSSELTEKLRAGSFDGTEALFEEVKKQYYRTIEAIRAL